VSQAERNLAWDQMHVRIFTDGDVLGEAAAAAATDAIAAAIEARGVAHAMFATGNSQVRFLESLTARPDVEWAKVVGFHMDEYYGIAPDHPASLRRYLQERLVARVDLRAFHAIRGEAPDPDAECARYTRLLRDYPLDLCCLGVGENGHLAFNDPPVADFDDPLDVKIVELDDASRRQQVGEGHFPSVDAVPPEAITVTIPALLRAGTVLAIVPEERKRQPVRRALEAPVSTECPASILRTRSNVTLFLDPGSAGALADPAA